MFAGLPLFVEIETKGLPVIPAELFLQTLGAIYLESDSAFSRIKIELTLHRDFQRQAIAARVVHAERIGNRSRLVVGQPQQFLPGGVAAFAGGATAMKTDAGHGLLRNYLAHRRDCFGNNGLGRHQVFLEQQGRNGEHVADVIEPVACVIGRELDLAVEINAEQVADGVAILDAVQSPGGDAARVRIGSVNAERVIFDPFLQPLTIRFRGLAFFGGWHQARARVFQHGQPQIFLRQQFII
jgi:hypothetical protein